MGQYPIAFVARHGGDHSIPPNAINYRANIKSLKDLGVESVFAVNVVGSMVADRGPGSLFVVDDFTKYIVHRWMHKIPLLWAIHKVHHSAKTMTPITVYRVHPLEGVLFSLRSIFAQGLVIPSFLFFFGNAVDLYTIVGVNILVFFFHATGSNLRHSHIDIAYWKWLEHILISPSQHQVHHSIAEAHYDKNFGAALAIWDWVFGSLHLSENKGDVVFGLDTYESGKEGKIKDLYLEPIYEIARIIKIFTIRIVSRALNRLLLIKDLFLVQIKKKRS